MKKNCLIVLMAIFVCSSAILSGATVGDIVQKTREIPGKYGVSGIGVEYCYADSANECKIVVNTYTMVNNVIDFSSQRVAVIDNIEGATASTLNATIDIEPNYTSEFDPETGATIYHFGLKPTSRRTTEAEAWDWLLRVIE